MAATLARYSDLDSVQILSHGAPGTLYLGSTVLDSSALDTYRSQLQDIGASLSETGDLLLYGCNVAQGANGQAFIDALARSTGADVAATVDLTGFDGNWLLESGTGAIEASSYSSDAYNANLAVIVGTNGADNLIGTEFDDTISGLNGNDKLTGGAGRDVAVFAGNADGYRLDVINGELYVVDIDVGNGNTGSDLLNGFEVLRFADKDLGISPDFSSPVGEVRLDT